jgi:hypothetical protein
VRLTLPLNREETDIYVEEGQLIDTTTATTAVEVTGRGAVVFAAGSRGFLRGNGYINGGSGLTPVVIDQSDPTLVSLLGLNIGGDHNTMLYWRYAGTMDLFDWTMNGAYEIGSAIHDSVSNYCFKCTTPGMAGSIRPTFNTTVGSTTHDGPTLVWTCVGLPFGEGEPYVLKYSDSASGGGRTGFASTPGWYSFVYTASATGIAFQVSGGAAVEGPGQIGFPNGFFMGSPYSRSQGGSAYYDQVITTLAGAVQVGGIWQYGDRAENGINAFAGSYPGWINTLGTAGSPTWTPYGLLESADLNVIDVSASGVITLTNQQCAHRRFKLTGTLTANTTIIVQTPAVLYPLQPPGHHPNSWDKIFWNGVTLGSHTLSICATTSDPGVSLAASATQLLMSDGVNVRAVA